MSVAPATGRLEQLGDPPARQPPARALVLEPDGAESASRAPAPRRGEFGRRHLDGVEDHRQRDRLAALEPRECAHDPARGEILRQPAPGLAGHDLDAEAAAELRLDVALVDRPCETASLKSSAAS